MSSSTEIARVNPVGELLAKVREDDFKQQLALALPPDVSADRFIRVTATALMQNPTLATLELASLLRSLLECAQIGLLPDGREAALVPFSGKATLLPMVGGYRKIAAEYGWSIQSAVVYENDEFDYELGLAPRLVHRPPRPGVERGGMIAAYAVARHADGRLDFEVMTATEIEKVKKTSRSAGKPDSPWNQWPERMYEKTPARRLFKKLALADSDRVRAVLAIDDLTPELASESLYGREERPAVTPLGGVDAADGAPPVGADAHAPLPEREAPGTTVSGGRQDEEAASSPAASSSPGPEEFAGEPTGSAFTAPPGAGEPLSAETLAANAAAEYVIPGGVHKGKRIREVTDDGWITWAVRQHPNPLFRAQVAAYARVYHPDAYAQGPGAAEGQQELAG